MISKLGDYVIENYCLKKLNLSWTEMKSDDLLFFIERVKETKHLQDLDISKIPIEGPNRIKVIESIKEWIITNRSLIHLNMSCCNLLPDQLEILAHAIKKSKSLLAVHLSGNNLNEEGKKLLRDFLFRKKKKKDMFFQVNEDQEPDSPRTIVSMVSNRFDRSRLQKMKYDLYKQNQQKKLGLVLDNRANFETVDDRIVVYRHLGHFEIKDGYTWKIHSSCWICDQWKYTCVIVNPSTIEGTFKDFSQINTKYYHKKIMDSNTEKDFRKVQDSTSPIIAGTFSNWKCREMIKIDKFYDCLIRNKLSPKRIYIEEKEDLLSRLSRILNIEIYTKFRNIKCFVSQKRQTAIERLLVKTAFKREAAGKNKLSVLAMKNSITSYSFKDVKPVSLLQKKIMMSIKKKSHFNWFFAKEHYKIALYRSFKYGAIFSTEIEKKLEQDNAHFMIPMDEIAVDHKELKESTNDNEDLSDYYLFATFMPPGDNKVIVSTQSIKDEESYYCCESIVPIRTEEVLLLALIYRSFFTKNRTKKKFEVRQFEKHKSVFRDWHEDTNETFKNSFSCDISKTRIRKYVAETKIYEEICDILFVNYQRLKEIFNHCIGISSYPNMSWLEFTKLCTYWKLPDRNNCLMSTIDTCFIAANFENNFDLAETKRYLSRHEFLEVLVRIADEKYKKSGFCKSLPEALGHLLNHNIFKHSDFIGYAQKFRDEELWKIHIDDLMFANMTNLRTIYNMILERPNTFLVLEHVEEFCKKLDLSISDKTIRLAFSLCKMTILDDIADREKYFSITFVEFLEFIARISQLVFKKNKSMKLFTKIFYILQKMFRLIPDVPIKPETDYILESESDDEEY